MTLDHFEKSFQSLITNSPADSRARAGALLRIIPRRAEWDTFLIATKQSWPTWQKNLESYPMSLVVLYGGLAFYEYEDTRFWPKFAEAVGSAKSPTGKLYNRLNEAYGTTVERIGLRLIKNSDHIAYVGSAVHHIGIPLSLWDDFLNVCDWALVSEGWRDLTEDGWTATVTRISGSRRRLKSFLVENREAASDIIAEMIEARQWLSSDTTLTIDGIKHVCLVRPEYFDEVPETAEFLRPENPESLLRDRPRLCWNEQRGSIVMHVQGLPSEKLPSTWSIDTNTFNASGTPNELPLDSTAFRNSFSVKLKHLDNEEVIRLAGAKPWALFDLEHSGYLVNSSREILPLRGYVLVSPKPLTIKRTGFEEEDLPENDPFELRDKSQCFITRLWPKDSHATLAVSDGSESSTLRFRTRRRIEARLFVGQGFRSAWYHRNGDQLTVEGLPEVCVLVPNGYFTNSADTLNRNFKVTLDGRLGGGSWEARGEALDGYELFHWKWSDRPFLESKEGARAKDFRQLGALFRSADIQGAHKLAIEARVFGIRIEYDIFIQRAKDGIARCWKNLPGKFLPWFLLTQHPDGLKSEELGFATPMIAAESKFPYYLLKKYDDVGLLVQRNRRWTIAESRAQVTTEADGAILLRFCGDPSIVWNIYRKLVHVIPPATLPEIVVSEAPAQIEKLEEDLAVLTAKIQADSKIAQEQPQSPASQSLSKSIQEGVRISRLLEKNRNSKSNRTLPYLKMRWPTAAQRDLMQTLKARNVRLVEDLWSH